MKPHLINAIYIYQLSKEYAIIYVKQLSVLLNQVTL